MQTQLTSLSPRAVYHNLRWLDQVDAVTSATYREQAQAILSDSSVSLVWRQAIADRLNAANHRLELRSVTQHLNQEDSY